MAVTSSINNRLVASLLDPQKSQLDFDDLPFSPAGLLWFSALGTAFQAHQPVGTCSSDSGVTENQGGCYMNVLADGDSLSLSIVSRPPPKQWPQGKAWGGWSSSSGNALEACSYLHNRENMGALSLQRVNKIMDFTFECSPKILRKFVMRGKKKENKKANKPGLPSHGNQRDLRTAEMCRLMRSDSIFWCLTADSLEALHLSSLCALHLASW